VWPSLTLSELARIGPPLDAQLDRTLSALSPSGLEAQVRYVTGAGQTFHTPLGDILLHLLLHGQYHRGKANAALRAIDAEAVGVDFIAWQRMTGASRTAADA
jgi:uncharacterized damage-inducible protein DinB